MQVGFRVEDVGSGGDDEGAGVSHCHISYTQDSISIFVHPGCKEHTGYQLYKFMEAYVNMKKLHLVMNVGRTTEHCEC